MQLHIAENSVALAVKAADLIQQTIEQKPNAVLGLATGSTPIATYQELIQRFRSGKIDFSKVKTFNLDEYYGLHRDHPQSYYTFMHTQLFDHINMQSDQIHIPSGTPDDLGAYCRDFERLIEDAGGIDLQLLGIGRNGHIGFNEPADELEPGTHLVRLSDETIEANSRFFTTREEVPTFAITMGIRTILSAKKVVLLALGREKAEIIHKLFHSGITTDLPASLLQLHPNVTILVDQEAGLWVEDPQADRGNPI
jgi:glucosamine-6-phosphate deaminase